MKYVCSNRFGSQICGKLSFVCTECLTTWPYKNKIEELERFKKDALDQMKKISMDVYEGNPWTVVPSTCALVAKKFLEKYGDE